MRARTYADVGTGQIGLVVDSYGLLSIAADRLSAAEELQLGAGDEVVLEPIDDDEADDGRCSSIAVTPRPRGAPDEAGHHHRAGRAPASFILLAATLQFVFLAH